jgi:starvation-inducible DNA-binding protein
MGDIATPRPSHEPVPVNIGLSESHRKQLSEGLQGVLADSYTLLGKTHGFLKLTTIKDELEAPKAQDMIRELVEDNETVVRACRGVVRICHDADDTVTEDLMNQRLRAHEKAAWMLRASLQP